MAEITAAMVNSLRSKTGLALMKCKQALVEAGGDEKKALENLRKEGVKESISQRASGEGRVVASSHNHVAAAVEVNCNTDFTAKSDAVGDLLHLALQQQLANPDKDVREDEEVKAAVTRVSKQTGENVLISKAVTVRNPSGHVGAYVYAITNKVAVLMSFDGAAPHGELMKQLGGHIAFAKPVGLTRDEVPADLVAKEREIAVEQAKATGKPQQIAEKIAEGKLNSFFAERVLLDQDFFNSQAFKGTVGQMLKNAGTTLVKYELVEVGK